VEPGAAQKSYGIQVAKMAGVPQDVITKASSLLSAMQKKELAHVENHSKLRLTEEEDAPQLSLF
jgi:DNA mismatch repair protein MutS